MFDVYVRVSRTGERSQEESTETYVAQCLQWADREGVPIGEIVEETNVSGSTAVAKRKLESLVQRVESGDSEGVITPYLDRFGRDLIEGALALKRIVDAGGKLFGVNDSFDPRPPAHAWSSTCGCRSHRTISIGSGTTGSPRSTGL